MKSNRHVRKAGKRLRAFILYNPLFGDWFPIKRKARRAFLRKQRLLGAS